MVIASTWWSIHLQTSGGWLSSTGDPSTVLPALVIVFFLTAAPFFLIASGKYKPTMDIQRIILSVLIASVLTLSTGWLATAETVTPGGTYWQSYGFPLPWRVEQKYGCPPWCLASVTTYNLWFFLVDLASSLAVVYALTPFAKRFSRDLAKSLGVLSTGRRISISWRNHRKKFSVLTMISLVALIGAESAILVANTSASSTCQPDCNGFGSLFIESFQGNSPQTPPSG